MQTSSGIHGESGVERLKLLSARHATERMLDAISSNLGLSKGQKVALLVNNLGATTMLEVGVDPYADIFRP